MSYVAHRPLVIAFALAHVALMAGCQLFNGPADVAAEKSKILSPLAGDDHIALEVFFVHMPTGDRQTRDAIWHDVDEQQLPADLRHRLAQHGLRAGVASGQIPQTVQNLIHATGTTSTASESDSADAGEAQAVASRQELRMRPSGKSEIVPCPPRDRITLMTVTAGELCGKTLPAAQGRFVVRCQPDGDGRVKVSLTPQLQYGEAKRRFVGEFMGGDGVLRPDVGQPKMEFDQLAVTAKLTPGNTIVVGCLDEPLSSLGRDFLTDNSSGKPVEKLLLVRLLQSQYDDALSGMIDEAE